MSITRTEKGAGKKVPFTHCSNLEVGSATVTINGQEMESVVIALRVDSPRPISLAMMFDDRESLTLLIADLTKAMNDSFPLDS